jgi:hypothetical protein
MRKPLIITYLMGRKIFSYISVNNACYTNPFPDHSVAVFHT